MGPLRLRTWTRAAGLLAALASSLPAAQAGGPPPGQQGLSGPTGGLTREQMWFAPTAEDWAKPCLITWQRTYEDAQAVSKETGKPILVCVNMDGEIASEHYAGIRYRREDTAKLYEPYVCVIASVYRHTPRDYDEAGERIECPRFGTVTCGEHIAIEPGLFDEYFEDTRVSPRHIGVELDGSEMYDVYYAWDTDSVFQTLEDGIANRPPPPPQNRGDRSLLEKVASRDVDDRDEVERAFRDGDATTRDDILRAASELGEKAPPEVLRLAVFGFDREQAALARQTLARTTQVEAAGVIHQALQVPMPEAEREGLVGALERLGEQSPWAQRLAVVHRGLGASSDAIDVGAWAGALDAYEATASRDWFALEERLDEGTAATRARPDDPAALTELAAASLALAIDPQTGRMMSSDRRTAVQMAQLLFEDARRAALDAEAAGAEGWGVHSVLAIVAYYLDDMDEAHRRAELAMEHMPAEARDWNAVAVLSLFAEARQQKIRRAMRRRAEWPPEWLADVNSAYAVLAAHPLGVDEHVVSHVDFLNRLNAPERAAQVLDAGLERFPESWQLHDRKRRLLLWRDGPAGLEAAYAEWLESPAAPPNLTWFAGYASIEAAEAHRRAGMQEEALAAYDRALTRYEQSIATNEDTRDSSDHYVALALGSRARVAFELGREDEALANLLASFARQPRASNVEDGLTISAVGTAKTIRARFRELGREEDAARVDAALEELRRIDPALLELPEWDRGGAPSPDAQRAQRRAREGRD